MAKSSTKRSSPAGAAPSSAQRPSTSVAGAKSAPNTATHLYLDTFNSKSVCKEDRDDIARKCGPEKKKATAEEEKKAPKGGDKSKAKLGKIADRVEGSVKAMGDGVKAAYGYKRNADNGWVEDHCAGLWVKPAGANLDKFNKEIDALKQQLNQDIADVLAKAGGKIVDTGANAATEYGKKVAIREGAALTSLVFPVAGEVIVAGVTLWNIADGIWTAVTTVVEMGGAALEAYNKINELKDQLGKLDELLNKKISPTDLWADFMTGLAFADPCLRARRCQLVPFKKTSARKQARSGQGCCPGQTGHHLLPEEMFQDCPAYTKAKHNNAPTVCVEGVNNTHGSHGIIHGHLEDKMKDHRDKIRPRDEISNKDAIDAAIKSHTETFGPFCKPECLRAQLKSYYGEMCEGKMKPRGGKGTDIDETSSSDDGQDTD